MCLLKRPVSWRWSIREGGHSLRTAALFDGESLPSTSDFDALVVMGGPMSVHDEGLFPWLRADKELIAAAIGEKKKVLGICLGSAAYRGGDGRAGLSESAEKRLGTGRWSGRKDAAGASLPGLAGDPGDGSGLAGVTCLSSTGTERRLICRPGSPAAPASTGACLNQGFLLGDNVLGLQFHPEVTPEIVRAMVDNEGHELVDGPYIQTGEEILAQAAIRVGGSGVWGCGPRWRGAAGRPGLAGTAGAALVSFLTSNTL